MQAATIKFNTPAVGFNKQRKIRHTWYLQHNLDDYGLDIEAAFHNYTARLQGNELPDIDKFCEYVKSKDPLNLICYVGKTSRHTN